LKIALPVIDAIKDTIHRNKLDVFRVDPFVSCHRVPENDNGKIEAVATAWAEIGDAMNCSIELTHHIRKTSGEVSPDDARGAIALINRARSVRTLNRMTATEAENANVENRMLYFRLNDGKVNLAPPAEAATWCHLESVSLGNSVDGAPPDLVGVATAWAWPSVFADVNEGDLREVQKRLGVGTYRADPKAENWARKMVAEVLGLDFKSASVKKDVRCMIRDWCKTVQFEKSRAPMKTATSGNT
jgi:AAA domain